MNRIPVMRPDGKLIKVVPRRGQLFVCSLGCCCGQTQAGHAPVFMEVYQEEWERRGLQNRVHLSESGCLGPCSLSNVALLLLDGQPFWFHSLNTKPLVRSLFEYISLLLAPKDPATVNIPPALADHVFNAFSWDGTKNNPEIALPLLPITNLTTKKVG